MSQIIEAIKRISIIAKKRNRNNLPATLLAYSHPYKTVENAQFENLTSEQLEIVNQSLKNFQPRLSLKQIKEIIKLYNFKLPREFYDFYQVGNGCLPIGELQNEDSNSIYSYFYFPDYDAQFWSLQNAMASYIDLLLNDNPFILPICPSYREDVVLSIVGSKEQQETSPLLVTYSDCVCEQDPSEMDVLFPSLTSMMLAYAELYEYKGKYQEGWKEEIILKYGGNPEWFYS